MPAQVVGPVEPCGHALRSLNLCFNASPGQLLQGSASASRSRCAQAWVNRARAQGLCPADVAETPWSSLDWPGLGRLDKKTALAFRSNHNFWLVWLKPRGENCDWLCLQLKPRPGPAKQPANFPMPPGSACISSLCVLPKGPFCYTLRCPDPPQFTQDWLRPQLLGQGWQSARDNRPNSPWALERHGQSMLLDLRPSPGHGSLLTLICAAPF